MIPLTLSDCSPGVIELHSGMTNFWSLYLSLSVLSRADDFGIFLSFYHIMELNKLCFYVNIIIRFYYKVGKNHAEDRRLQ